MGDDLPAGDHGHALAQLVRLEHVVRGEQDRLARLPQPGNGLAQLPCADGVEPDRRLVEEDHLGVVEQPAGDVQPLAHAARVRLDALPLAAAEADHVQQLVDPPALLADRHACRRPRRT